MVDVKYIRHLKRFIPLQELKALHLEHKASNGESGVLTRFVVVHTVARVLRGPFSRSTKHLKVWPMVKELRRVHPIVNRHSRSQGERPLYVVWTALINYFTLIIKEGARIAQY